MLTRWFLFHPTATPLEPLARARWEIDRVTTADGCRLVGLVRPPAAPDAPWLLFFGGNAMGLDAAHAVLGVTAGPADWGLAAYAYRGYDGSEGAPSEATLLADARELAGHLGDPAGFGVAPARLILIGQSLGTGVAADLAAHLARAGTPAAGLALLSPFTSMVQVLDDLVPLVPMRWLVSDRFHTDRIAADIPSPVLLIHGDADALISIEHSRTLARLFGERASLVGLGGRGHNDLWEDRGTVLALRDLVATAVARNP